MRDFVDREIAIQQMNTLFAEQTIPWMVLAGRSKIGKTEFAKKIVSMYKNAFLCCLTPGKSYAYSFVQSIYFDNNAILEKLVYNYARTDVTAQNIFSSIGLRYISTPQKNQLLSIINLLIKNDISSGLYTFAHYLGESAISNISFIFLDDFHCCDYDSYCWILEFWNSLKDPMPIVVAVCNFELNWESHQLKNTFQGIISPISIERFDTEYAFYEIMKDHFYFKNDLYLLEISKQVFSLYDGDARLLFETLKLLKGQVSSATDESKKEQILNVAQQIYVRSFDGFSKIHLQVLQLLAYCPVPISKDNIMDILELVDPIAAETISYLYNRNFIIQIAHKLTAQTMYTLNDDFLTDIIKSSCSVTEKMFYETKLYRAAQKGQINISLENMLTIAIELEPNEAADLLIQYIYDTDKVITEEKKSYYIDKLLNSECFIPEQLISIDNVHLLYMYGYYLSAKKLMNFYNELNPILDFDSMMLLGDIQHVLLLAESSKTYKIASEIQGIDISDKLKALSRQIMALNQEHQEKLAKELYQNAFAQYEAVPCMGLVELYRNSNNSFGYSESIKYTTKGYFLAKSLNEELEMYKCLHNICMIRLQYGYYDKPLENNPFGFEPTFEYVLDYFVHHSEYRHEQAYPLLDIGTAKMFDFVNTHDLQYLILAKRFYSEAQLYAKSFYARHIAETGLLIVNSYQYADEQPSFIKELRVALYNRYLQEKDYIEDYRVHRKVLLSLALSAIISKEKQEACIYLETAKIYILGEETLRYNKLCQKAGCIWCKKEPVPLNGKNEVYYGSDEFVPWLISLCH